MKLKYIIALVIISIVLIVACCYALNLVLKASFSDDSNIDRAIQIGVIFAALFASFMALITAASGLDPKPKQIKSKISVKKVDEIRPYDKNDMSEKLKKYYKAYPDIISSYQFHFVVKNESDFDLKKPTITIRIPSDRKCPYNKKSSSQFTERVITTDLYGYPKDLRKLDSVEHIILSNNLLPFLNKDEEIPFWVRMIINDQSSEQISVKVSLNSENAEGHTEEVLINPKELISNSK